MSLVGADGLQFRWQGCLFCSLGCCSIIVHGAAGILNPEMANSWWSWHSIAHPCWSRGTDLSSCDIVNWTGCSLLIITNSDCPCVYFQILLRHNFLLRFSDYMYLNIVWTQIFTNFLSSVMIHATRPFVVNEWIQTKIEGYEVSGTVEVCIYLC